MTVIREAKIVIDVVDNVTAALKNIDTFIDALSSDAFSINFNINDALFTKLNAIETRINSLCKPASIDIVIDDNTDAAARNISKNADKASNSLEKIGVDGKKIGNEFEDSKKKSAGFFSTLETGTDRVSKSLGSLTSALAGVAIAGAATGYSWMSAKDEALFKQEALTAIETKGGKTKGPKNRETAEKFINEANDLGYTSESKRTELIRSSALNIKNTPVPMDDLVSSVRGAEKLAFSSHSAQRYGFDANKLMGIASGKSTKLSDTESANLDSLFKQYDIQVRNFSSKSRKTKLKLLAELDTKIDIEKAMKDDPDKVLSLKLDKMSKSIGTAMTGPMLKLVTLAEKIADVFANSPALSGIAGYGLIFITAATAIGLFVNVINTAFQSLTAIGKVLGLVSAKEGQATIAQGAHTAATVTGTGAENANVAAKNTGIITRMRLAASTYAASIAERLHAAATVISSSVTSAYTAIQNISIASRIRQAASTLAAVLAEKAHNAAAIIGSAVTWARVAATTAVTAALLIGSGVAAAASAGMGVLAAAESIASAGAYALAAGVWAALAPILPFVAAGAAIVGVLALLAHKAGLLEPILKGLGAIDLGRVWKDLKKGDLGKAWHDLTKGFKLPSLDTMWENLKSPPDISKLVPKLKAGIQAAFSLFGKPGEDLLADIQKILKKIADFVGWIVDKISSLVQWIKDGLGITKSEKEKKLEKLEDETGIHWNDQKNAWFNAAGGEVQNPPAQLIKAKAAADNAPDSVFSKVGELITGALSGLMQPIADVLDPLSIAITKLLDWLNWWRPKPTEKNVYTQDPLTKIWTDQNGKVVTMGDDGFGNKIATPETPPTFTPTETLPAPNTPARTLTPGEVAPSASELLGFQYEPGDLGAITGAGELPFLNGPPQMASGGDIKKTGSTILHKGEEVAPAEVVSGAKTSLSKIKDVLDGLPQTPSHTGRVLRDLSVGNTMSARSSNQINVGGFKLEINNPSVPDAAAAYHLSSVLKRELEPFIEDTIKRKVSQYIT